MKLPRNLSGASLIKILIKRFDYVQVHQVGSHVILETEDPSHQRIAIPDHKVLRVGTLNSIIASVAKHKQINKAAILEVFS